MVAATDVCRCRRRGDESAGWADGLGPSWFHEHLVEMILHLPDGPRRRLLAHLIGQHAHNGLAGRLVGIMSDAQLARALVDLAGDGHDPMLLAHTLADGPGGRTHLPALIAALMQGHEEAGTIMAVEVVGAVDERAWVRSAPVLETVSDLLARDLKATESDDTRALQEEFARVDGSSSLRSAVLADYLSLEGGGHRLGEALSLWTVATREALRRRDGGALEGRLRSLETARARADQKLPASRCPARRNFCGSTASPRTRVS